MKIKRALISVYDKTGIVDFARTLVEEFGIEILSTGGTAKLLKENHIPVTLVEDITGWGEMLDGRVKTLHPKIHAGILADRDNPDHMRQLAEAGIEPIDMVVVNLYPFEKTVADPGCKFEDAIEMIDIGGPCMLRAAAKNHRHVLPVAITAQYEQALVIIRGDSSEEERNLRQMLAGDAFRRTAGYDARINAWLQEQQPGHALGGGTMFLELARGYFLNYGENPHQEAVPCSPVDWTSNPDLLAACNANDQALSYNNLMDANAALALCTEVFRQHAKAAGRQPRNVACVAMVKHTNACGFGIANDQTEAYRRAYLGDPHAAMGGVLACSGHVDAAFAETVMHSLDRWGRDAGAGAFFVEVWLAPRFDDAAIQLIRSAKKWGNRARLLAVGDLNAPGASNALEIRSLAGGVVFQTPDTRGLNEHQWEVVTDRQPTDQEMNDLRLAWLVCKHTKSNAISICKDGMLIGNGAGQMSRVMSCRIATWLATENGHADKLAGSVAASDAFFPFRDGPDILADAGVTAIIQPGGSKRDADTIAACNERGIAMIFTGTRHFMH